MKTKTDLINLANVLKQTTNCKQIRDLVKKKDINMTDEDNNTLLHIIANSPDLKLALRLIKLGANINIKNNLGQDPVDIAHNFTGKYEDFAKPMVACAFSVHFKINNYEKKR